MSKDIELKENETPGLLRTGSLCSPDPHQQLLTSFNDRDFDNFKKILTNGVQNNYIDPNFWYDDPDYGTLLDLALQKPNNYQYIKLLLSCGSDPNKVNPTRKKSPLHFAIESNDITYINLIINDNRCNVNVVDNTGASALHYAAKLQNVDCMIALINHPKINVNLSNRKGLTPMHVAAQYGTEETVLCLLQKDNIDIDTFKTGQGKTARDLILENYPNLEDKLSNFKPNSNNKEGEENDSLTAQNKLFYYLHNHDFDNFVTAIKVNKNLINSNDGYHTLLQCSCEFGLNKFVGILLRFGADPNLTTSTYKLTPIMIASYKGYVDIVRLFINIDSTRYYPIDGETVLHSVIKGSTEIVPSLGSSKDEYRNHYECLELLLKENVPNSKLDINCGDVKGSTALHYAAKLNDKDSILLLLKYGAYVGKRNKLNEPALADISPKIFETYLDSCLYTNGKIPREDNYEIIFKYNFLAPPQKNFNNKLEKTSSQVTLNIDNNINSNLKNYKPNEANPVSETDPLLYMSRSSELRPLLKHPVLTSFLHLKWHKIRCLFYFNLTFYIIFWLLLTAYILLAYVAINKNVNNSENKNSNLTKNISTLNDDQNFFTKNNYIVLQIFVSIFLTILILRELFQLTISPLRYLSNPENWLEVALIGVTITILFCESCNYLRHQIAAVTILLSWSELILLIGRHPALSTNIEMLKTVSWNFLKFLAWYSILIIAFALSFYTLFCDSDTSDDENYFVDPAMSVFKTVVMLTGEFDAGSIPFVTHPGTSHILFVLFVFLIAIVLFNLLNGLAVSDTQSIIADAELVGYVSRVKLISYVETMAMGDPIPYNGFIKKFKNLFCCVPNDFNCCTINYSCLKIFSRKINLFPDLFPDCEVRILPNQESKIEMYHSGHRNKKRQSIEMHHNNDDDSCFDICYNLTMDPEIVKSAKLILIKKQEQLGSGDSSKIIENYRQQLDEYKSTLNNILRNYKLTKKNETDDVVNETSDVNDLNLKLNKYNDSLKVLIKNSERNEERLNQVLKFFQEKKSFLNSSSSDEDNQ